MIITTTNEVQQKPIQEYLGVVFGEAILGTNVFRDIGAGIRDMVGGRSGSYEKKLVEARETALSEMIEKAAQRGANAVVGVDVDYETVGNNMMMVSASGTAVVTA